MSWKSYLQHIWQRVIFFINRNFTDQENDEKQKQANVKKNQEFMKKEI